MAAFKEIVTKAVVGKGKKYFKNNYTVSIDEKLSLKVDSPVIYLIRAVAPVIDELIPITIIGPKVKNTGISSVCLHTSPKSQVLLGSGSTFHHL